METLPNYDNWKLDYPAHYDQESELPAIEKWQWLLSAMEKVGNNYVSLETEKLTACEECAYWQWHMEVPHGSELALATALEKMAARIRSVYA
jgi:hypothetical protein